MSMTFAETPDARRSRWRGSCSHNTWVLVLAGGEGTRLQGLIAATYGRAIPKQFCSLYGGPSLLQQALDRGRIVASNDHLCAIVAGGHQHWWQAQLSGMLMDNIIVQPDNRGTANGILLPLLEILRRDSDANVLLLPSDHSVDDEAVLADSLRQLVAGVAMHPDQVHFLGIEPEEPDPELGYIVPGRDDGQGSFSIARFVEKPSVAGACGLIEQGALWNSFIVAARGQALLDLFSMRVPEWVMEMSELVRRQLPAGNTAGSMQGLYARLPVIDFSSHILQKQEAALRVLPAPRCGWSDLGTPRRVVAALQRQNRGGVHYRETTGASAPPNLAMAAGRDLTRGDVASVLL